MPTLPIASEQLFAHPTRLTTPYVHGGKTYTWAAVFRPVPSRHNDGVEILRGIVHSATLDGDIWTIICNRGTQYSDYTHTAPGTQPSQVPYPVSTGGNIADSRESMRVLSYANDIATIGTLSASRAVPGDGFQIDFTGARYLCEIITAQAYAADPGTVDFREETPTTRTQRMIVDVSNIAANLSPDASTGLDEYIGGTPYFQPGLPAPFDASYLLLYDGATYTPATQYLYTNPTTGLPEPTVLPTDWGNGITDPTYWWDQSSYEARLSHPGTNTTALLAYYLLDVVTAPNISHDCAVLIESLADHTGIGTTADAYPSSSWTTLNDFDITFRLSQPSIAHWRQSTAAGSTGVFATHDGSRILVHQRDTTDAASVLLATHTIALPCQIRLVKIADAVEVSARPTSGDSWTVLTTSYPSSLPDTVAGILGVGRPLTGAASYLLANIDTQTRTLMPIGESVGNGRQHVARLRSCPIATTATYSRAASTSIISVINHTSLVAMTPSTTPRRDHYNTDGSNLIFYGETTGDDVRILYAAAATTGTPPGDAPRTQNQPNFATFADPGSEDHPRRASTNTAENLANWRDVLTIQRPAGSELIISPGDEFTIIRGRGVWSESNPPDIYHDTRNDPDTDFQLLDPADYLLRAYQGLLLATEELRAALPESFCLLADAPRYVHTVDQSNYNEPIDAIQLASNLWFPAFGPNVAGAATGFSASASLAIGPTTWSINEVTPGKYAYLPDDWTPSGPVYALITGGGPGALGDNYTDAGSWHYNIDGHLSNFGYLRPVIDKTTNPQIDNCIDNSIFAGPGYRQCYDNWSEYQADNAYVDAAPFDAYTDTGYGGVTYWAGATINDGTHTQVTASCSFQRIPITLDERLRRLPEGSTILEAILEVKVGGGKFQTWTQTGAVRQSLTGTPQGSRLTVTINGAIQRDFCDNIALGPLVDITNTVDMTATTGGVAFTAVGVRHDSTLVVLNYGGIVEAPTDRILSTGGTGGLSTAIADEWCVVDITPTVQQMVNLLNSQIAIDGWFLFPSGGQPSAVSTGDSIEGFIAGTLPSVSTTYALDIANDHLTVGSTQTGHWWGWETLEIRAAYCRVQFPSGLIEDIPLITPPAV